MKRSTANRRSATLSCRSRDQRQGIIVVFAAVLMVIMIGMLAFSLDIGYIAVARTEIQRSVDSGAIAGAGRLGEGVDVARASAIEYVQHNRVGGTELPLGEITVEFGEWDDLSRSFLPPTESPSAVRVLARQQDRPYFFGRIFGQQSFAVEAEAIATYRPRDIVVVLDYSASMNDDSELKYISKLGRAAIEANLLQIYTELGAPTFGAMQWTPQYIASDSAAVVKATLGIDSVPYPYPGGSWNDYINYVKTSGSISGAGYKKKYGYLTLVNYWLENQPMSSQTPDLWQTSEQPITAVKDAFSIFLAYMDQGVTSDRVGLAVYTAGDGTAVLESELTDDFSAIEDISRHRQAGHYDHFTNIGAGMKKAREELQQHGRGGAQKMIVLMTDGIANRPNNTSTAKAYVRQESQLAVAAGYPIVTISLGSAADKALMQEVADTTGGVHFNVPGGQSVAGYEEALKDVFRKIADDRPLQLVK